MKYLSFCYVTNLTVVRFGFLVVTFCFVLTSLYYTTKLRECQVYRARFGANVVMKFGLGDVIEKGQMFSF